MSDRRWGAAPSLSRSTPIGSSGRPFGSSFRAGQQPRNRVVVAEREKGDSSRADCVRRANRAKQLLPDARPLGSALISSKCVTRAGCETKQDTAPSRSIVCSVERLLLLDQLVFLLVKDSQLSQSSSELRSSTSYATDSVLRTVLLRRTSVRELPSYRVQE